MPRDNQGMNPQRPAPGNYPDLDRIRWEPLYPPEQGASSGIPSANRPSMLPRIVAFVLLGAAIAIAAAFFREICAFFSKIERLHDQPTDREAFLGLSAFGLALVAVLAVLKIVLSAQNRRG